MALCKSFPGALNEHSSERDRRIKFEFERNDEYRIDWPGIIRLKFCAANCRGEFAGECTSARGSSGEILNGADPFNITVLTDEFPRDTDRSAEP